MSIDALRAEHDNWEHSICNEMVLRNFAVRIEEACCSRLDHEERVAARAVNAYRLPVHQVKEYVFRKIFYDSMSLLTFQR